MAKKTKKPELDYPKLFDRMMGQHFEEEFETEWNLFAGSFGGYVTVRKNGKKLTKQMAKVGKTISDTIAATQEELHG